jgi:hypothetical protein
MGAQRLHQDGLGWSGAGQPAIITSADDDNRRWALLDLVFELVGRVEPTGGLATPASVARTTRAPSITADTSPIVPSTRNAACRSAPADV